MNSLTNQQLLHDYAERRSEAAFSELVRRHVDFVYSAALRMVRDSQLAKDVTQSVFVALAQNARPLTDHPVLSGWLHRTTQNLAANAVRSDVRRRAREQEAAAMNELLATESDNLWDHVAPHLDAGLGELSEPDRDALLLRYFEGKSAREMAQTLGVSDDAAQKRASRAVDRLRDFFVKRGITVGASGLAVAISANAVQAAPVGLGAVITAGLAGTAAATIIATQTGITTMKIISAKTLATTLASALLAGGGVYFVQQRQADDLRQANQALAAEMGKIRQARDSALSAVIAKNDELEQWQKKQSELLRLRGEVGLLRQQAKDLEKARIENQQLRATLAKAAQPSQKSAAESESEEQLQASQVMIAMNHTKQLVLGMHNYAGEHQGQLPASVAHLADAGHAENLDQFELVLQGTLTNVANPSQTLAVRQKLPTFINGSWVKVYGFADGSVQSVKQPPEGFEAWEKQWKMPSPAGGTPPGVK